MRNIIFIAPPAAGKGTMSEILINKYGYHHISTGNILREMATKNDELGKTISELLSRGELVPNEIVYEAIKKKLSQPELKNGYILDGFPRNLEQALEYDKILSEIKNDIGVCIYLDTPREILEKRITGRRICSVCGETHNVLTNVNAPKIDGICNKCGNKLITRSDDNLESFDNRYNTYLEKTSPILNYYKEKNILYNIKSINPEETIKEIEAIIND